MTKERTQQEQGYHVSEEEKKFDEWIESEEGQKSLEEGYVQMFKGTSRINFEDGERKALEFRRGYKLAIENNKVLYMVRDPKDNIMQEDFILELDQELDREHIETIDKELKAKHRVLEVTRYGLRYDIKGIRMTKTEYLKHN